MPYGKRSYRRNRKYNRRFRYSRLIRNRSSIAQAGQIKALSSRINRVYRRLKPDTNVYVTAGDSLFFDNSAFANTYYMKNLTIGDFAGGGGPGMIPKEGLSLKLYNCRFFGTFEYTDTFIQQAAIDHQRSCMTRIIIAQRIQGSANQPVIGDIIDLSNAGPEYELNAIKPLRDNVTTYMKILYDRAYTLSDQQPIKTFNINLRKILPFRFGNNDASHYGSFVFIIVTAGLHWDASYHQQVKCSWASKLAMPQP